MEDVKKSFKELQLQKMGDEEVKKYLEKWFENAKKTPDMVCGFYYDKGPFIHFFYHKGENGIDYANADTPMDKFRFYLPETIRAQLVATYTSYANAYKLKIIHHKAPRSYTLCSENLNILVKVVRIFMNILGTEYGKIKFEQW